MDDDKAFALRCAVIVVTATPMLQLLLDFTAKVLLHDTNYHGDDKVLFACLGAVLTIIYYYFKKPKA